ncbi:hypothetical protein AgCh_035315 [Apium graveolens]
MEDHQIFGADTLVEEREVVMHQPCGGNPTLRNAHFLKPIFSEHENNLPTPPSSVLSSKPTFVNLKNLTLNSYKAHPSEKWKIWVHSLKPKYQEIWKQAGIYEAILASTYKILRDKEVIFGLAERWCAETNTFVFPWGEVTITLEDVLFLGGFSVLGALYLTPLPDECVSIFDSLKNAYREVKMVYSKRVFSSSMWMEYFMCSGKDLEHEAFLAMWLSRFVLPNGKGGIVIGDFHVAIHLSRGNRIALAPVVLASIYTDMRLAHNSVNEFNDLESKVGSSIIFCHSDLVLMWAWERFSELRPTPCVIERTEPRSARWNKVKILEVKDVRAALDSGKESFLWRPYVINSSNCMLSKLYGDNEQWVAVESDETQSLARCLRVSELIGLGNIEQYLPHRVAMQFGLDQDVPPHVIRSKESPKIAWRNYNRSIRGMKLYIPPRLLESDVSSRYVTWWRDLLPVNEQVVTTCSQKEKHLPLISWGHKRRRSKLLTTPGCVSERPDDYLEEGSLTVAQEKSPSIETLPRKIKSSKRNDETVLKIMQLKDLKDDAIVSSANNVLAEVNYVNIKLTEDEAVRKTDCPENNIVNIEEETCDSKVADTCTLVEERQAAMYSPCGRNPTLRNAHFLKPNFSEKQNHLPSAPTSIFSSKPTMKNSYKFHSRKGYPSEKWKIWVHSLKPKYQEIWKQAGIYEAILASTYTIPNDKELIIGLAERWCAETNTFVFPWGEVTITLEDVLFLGGYSVLGALYLTPLPDESVGIFNSLKKVYQEIRLINGGYASSLRWIDYFMFSGKDLEHEAFLAMWLSRFALIRSVKKIVLRDFEVAIHLSRGKRIAFAPVILASIYTNMRQLHNSIVQSINLDSKVCLIFSFCHPDLVQMWAWERFPKLRQTPSVVEREEPRSARWNGVKRFKVRDVRAILDSGKESFIWRPYVKISSSCMLSKLYRDNEQWVVVESDDTESFVRCLRVSELVGLDCIEQYLPHRVAMQFGLDQDIPSRVIQSNESPKTAWRIYKRSVRGTKLYIPPRLLKSDVSSRYVVWWRGHLPVDGEMVTTCIQNEKHLPPISWGHKRRRSRKARSRKSENFGKRKDLDDMLLLKTHSGTESA